MTKRDAPATHRNREPILEVLARWLPEPAGVLEIASGTGQHAVYFAARMPHLVWQPSDVEATNLESIRAWIEEAALPNVRPPIRLDAREASWPCEAASGSEAADGPDAIFNANMIHIAPWNVAEGLFAGAGRVLPPGGRLILYGPFKRQGAHTAPSNEAFDEGLRQRDPSWGVRDLETVEETAARNGLARIDLCAMPANNLMLLFERR